MGFREAEVVTDLDADLPVQWGIYFKDTEVLQGGFEDLEDVEEHVKFLVSHGTIYSHEYKIVKIRYEIEEVV